MTSHPPAARRQKGFENKIFSAFSTRRQSFFKMKYKQNIWLQPGMANFFASPLLSLAADAGAWKSYSYTEQHSPKTSQPLLNCWLQKKSFIFLLPHILTIPKSILFYLFIVSPEVLAEWLQHLSGAERPYLVCEHRSAPQSPARCRFLILPQKLSWSRLMALQQGAFSRSLQI